MAWCLQTLDFGLEAVKLCMKMLQLSSDVLYCLFHDFLPDGFDWGTKDSAGGQVTVRCYKLSEHDVQEASRS